MKKRKKLKIFILAFTILLLAAVSYIIYELKFKTYDVADDEVSEIVAEPYKIELPDGSVITIDDEGNLKEETDTIISTSSTSIWNNSTTKNETNSETQIVNKQSGANLNLNSPTDEIKPTSKTITNKYVPALKGLESQADSKINALLSRAKGEYLNKKENGESINLGYFYNKYMAAAKELEKNTDSVFYSVIAVVEEDLLANGFRKTEAQSLKDEYELMKKSRRDNILDKVLAK